MANATLALSAEMVLLFAPHALPLLIPSVALQDVQLIAPLAMAMVNALFVITAISFAAEHVLLARVVLRAIMQRLRAVLLLTLSV
jgi:hypothetical protein